MLRLSLHSAIVCVAREQLCASFTWASDLLVDAACLAGIGYDVVDAVSHCFSQRSRENLTPILGSRPFAMDVSLTSQQIPREVCFPASKVLSQTQPRSSDIKSIFGGVFGSNRNTFRKSLTTK